MEQILIVEDDRALNAGIRLALRESNRTFLQAYSMKEGEQTLRKQNVDLVLLDVNLPDGNGLDLLGQIKQSDDVAVILLTANDMELDIVTGLELGADDYITKPFQLMVLRARVNTQLRKRRELLGKQMEQVAVFGPYRFDFIHMKFWDGDRSIELSKTEQKLLLLLTKNKNITISRSELVDRIWTDGADYVDENALSVTVKRLRVKLSDTGKNNYIKTVYGIGYMWVVE